MSYEQLVHALIVKSCYKRTGLTETVLVISCFIFVLTVPYSTVFIGTLQ